MKNTDNTLQNLLDKSFSEFNLVQGSLVKANVVEIGKKWVTLDIGFKSDGLVSIEEFHCHLAAVIEIYLTKFKYTLSDNHKILLINSSYTCNVGGYV